MQETYKRYMDTVTLRPAFRQQLQALHAPQRHPVRRLALPLAAALALVLGAGAFALREHRAPTAQPNTEQTLELGLAQNGSDVLSPSGGGYELVDGDSVSYTPLPDIAYGERAESIAVDYDIAVPEGGTDRTATQADVVTLVGGETALSGHLSWDGLSWTGRLIQNADGSLTFANLSGVSEQAVVSLEVLTGDELPPSCLVMETDAVTDVYGTSVRGYRSGGCYSVYDESGEPSILLEEGRTIEFVANGAGCRLQVWAATGEEAEMLCARFARLAIVDGLNLSLQQPASEPSADGAPGESPPYDPNA